MKLVTAPVPRSLTKRRQTTKSACSAIASEEARASSPRRASTASVARRPHSARRRSAVSGTASVTTPFSERAPRARDDPVLVDPPEDEREAQHAPERVAGSGGRIAVVRGEPARAERSEQVRDGRGDEEHEGFGGDVLRARRQAGGQLSGTPVAREDRQRERRRRDDPDRERVRGEEAPERAFGAGAGELREHRRAHRARRQDEHEEDAVGGEEPVRLHAAADLSRDHDADRGGQPGHDGDRHRRQHPAREGASTRGGARLSHCARKRTPYGRRSDLDRQRHRRPAARVRATPTAAAPSSSPGRTGSWART